MYDDYDHRGRRNTEDSLWVHRAENGRVSRHSWSGMEETYALDPQTGLPQLTEEGTYFRVDTKKVIAVRYMQKRWWWFDKVRVTSLKLAATRKLSEDDVLWLALSVLDRWGYKLEEERDLAELDEKLRKEKAAVKENNARFHGKYPPKKLEVK